jgi:hypothetical protein
VPPMQTLSGLIADAHAAIRFLDCYTGGRRGYTAQDARAGAGRLTELCRQIDLSVQATRDAGASVPVLDAAEECLRRVRGRLGHTG